MNPDLDVSKLEPDETRPVITLHGQTLVPVRNSVCEGCVAWDHGTFSIYSKAECSEIIEASGTRCGSTLNRPSAIWVVPTPEMLERHAVARALHRLES